MLKTRVLTSLALLISFLLALFYLPANIWEVILLVVIVIGASEWSAMSGLRGYGKLAYGLLVAVLCILSFSVLSQSFLLLEPIQYQIKFWVILTSTLLWLFVVPFLLISATNSYSAYIKLLLGLIVLMGAWFAFLSLYKVSPLFLLITLATVWIADSAAYFSGKKFGKHKLAPSISPGKTWEGVVGAFLAVTIYGLCIVYFFKLTYWIVLGFWCVLILSIIGDLFESQLKRQAGLKDSGSILPGHGGVLDRIDGIVSTLPFVAFCFHFPLYYQFLVRQ